MNRVYLVIDLKTFYASVECVERGIDPFNTNLVVADPSRGKGGICLAITPAMKMLGIKNRCRLYEIPEHVKYTVALPRMNKYIEYSANIYAIYLKYVSKDDIYPYSIDECFLDVTNYLKTYNMVSWCACFVSWCADQCNYIENGTIPKFSACTNGMNWFKEKNQWQDRSNDFAPLPGFIIFFDWADEKDGVPDHVGIVEKSDDKKVYTIEGNAKGDICKKNTYDINSDQILGYGIPKY